MMGICKNCIMPETNPYIKLDEDNVCNICNNYIEESNNEKQQSKDKSLFFKKIQKHKSLNSKYDCIVSVSGGKDSLMVLYLAKKEFGLNPLAVFIDNGFISQELYQNVLNASDILDVEVVIIKTPVIKKLFKHFLLKKKKFIIVEFVMLLLI